MIQKMLFPRKSFHARFALVRRFTSMLPDMIQQMLFSCECFRTKVTSMIRFARMPEDVIREMLFASERFPAYLTTKRCLLKFEKKMKIDVIDSQIADESIPGCVIAYDWLDAPFACISCYKWNTDVV